MKNEILTTIVIMASITVYSFFVKYMLHQKRELKKVYLSHVKQVTHNNVFSCVTNPIRDKTFFKMTNAGDNPCDLDRELTYVDYIGNSNMYMEININE